MITDERSLARLAPAPEGLPEDELSCEGSRLRKVGGFMIMAAKRPFLAGAAAALALLGESTRM